MLEKWLKESSYTIVFTGAGMSTESGLPDFRSAKSGLWRTKNPQQLASTYAMQHNRDEFIAFYQYRIRTLLKCKPHVGHMILADWQKRGLFIKSSRKMSTAFTNKQAVQMSLNYTERCEQCIARVAGEHTTQNGM
ncbi:NAD-dependent protein deacylase [Anoxybacillus sp. BCO1]|nr:NAD-dependent protein deacylase [Anoxybacillus sp. BCO1]